MDIFVQEIIYEDGYAKNLKKDGLGVPLITWTGKNNNDSLWYMHTFLEYSSGEYSTHFIAKETPYDPGICSFVLGVKSTADWSEYYLAFPYDSLGYEELYMNLDPFYPDFTNFTNLESISRNPNSFFGEPGENSCFYAYMAWETLVNGKWQLYYAKVLECIGSVEENKDSNNFIKIRPSPFTEKIEINYFIDEPSQVKIDILDILGQPVSIILDEYQVQGLHNINWTVDNKLDKGVYFIRLLKDEKSYIKKVIKAN